MSLRRDNILTYQNGRFAWIALGLLIVCLGVFSTYSDDMPASGSTWQGYVLGGVSAALVVWLALLGIRKRSYRAAGKTQAWVSAHVYLGVALLGVVTLHTGGQLGWNIHSAGYWMLVIVVLSGMLGTWMYLVIPRRATENRKGRSRENMFEELSQLNAQCVEASAQCAPETELAVQSSISGTVIGGGLWDQLLALDHSTYLGPEGDDDAAGRHTVLNRRQSAILKFVASRAPRAANAKEADALQELVSLIARRQELLGRIRKDIQLQGWLRIWLFVHVPVTFALLCTLVTHIIVVFMYW